MTEDQEAREEQEKRAERLREEIDRLKGGDEEVDRPPRSPREFIEERMRELDCPDESDDTEP